MRTIHVNLMPRPRRPLHRGMLPMAASFSTAWRTTSGHSLCIADSGGAPVLMPPGHTSSILYRPQSSGDRQDYRVIRRPPSSVAPRAMVFARSTRRRLQDVVACRSVQSIDFLKGLGPIRATRSAARNNKRVALAKHRQKVPATPNAVLNIKGKTTFLPSWACHPSCAR